MSLTMALTMIVMIMMIMVMMMVEVMVMLAFIFFSSILEGIRYDAMAGAERGHGPVSCL